jgi:CheY-like chemotaxis protein
VSAGPPSNPTPRPEVPAPRALVVENDLASRELLARVLRRKGLDARTAVGAAQAAAHLLDTPGPYDLLIVDLDLGPVDGVELLRHVAALPAGRRPGRLVAISDNLAPYYPRLAELRIPVETFQKPVHLPTLMKVLDGLAGRA